MQTEMAVLPYKRTLDAKPNAESIVKPGELVDVIEMSPLTLVDRRVYNLLLANAWDHLLEEREHIVSKRDLQGPEFHHKGSAWLDQSMRRLMSAIVEIRRVGQNGEMERKRVALLGPNATPERDDGQVRYRFDRDLLTIIAESRIFARLHRTIMFKLSSKYSLALYEIIQKRGNLSHKSSETFTLAELRGFLGVPKDKLTSWINLKNKAIAPAIDEVSRLSEYRIWFTAEDLKKDRAKIVGLTLQWERKSEAELAELASTHGYGQVGRALAAAESAEIPAPARSPAATVANIRLAIRTDTREKAKKLLPGYDIYFVEQEWKDWVASAGKEAPRSPDGAFIAFCKQYADKHPL